VAARTTIYLRADGSAKIGLGHVHRLLALADILNQTFNCTFVIRNPLPGVKKLIYDSCQNIIEIQENEGTDQEIERLQQILSGKDIIVLDGYGFNTAYQRSLLLKGSKLVCIDDIHSYHFVSDLVINPSGGISSTLYSLEPYTKLVTGPAYALLKRPFRHAAQTRGQPGPDGSLFVCMGGADPDNNTLSILKLCLEHCFEKYIVILGEAYLHRDRLREYVSQVNQQIQILDDVAADKMVELMKMSSVAVCSASGIAYEYLAVGGELYIQQTADNQGLLYEYLITEGLAFPFSEFRTSKERVARSRVHQLNIFDGESGIRLLKLFNRLDFKLHMSIRQATVSDMMTLFQWANEPELRRQSYHNGAINIEDHERWFNRKLADPNCIIFMFEFKKMPLGMVRFDLQQETTLSYSIAKEFRAKGLGRLLIEEALKKLAQQVKKPSKIVGFVKRSNEASNRIFSTMGFQRYETDSYPESYKYELIL
jgi:UDP-2,4-diacetamido-2,4,6-trideoxy-beta-L-altropyranose hydrolase